eukprot:TRINITY_DN337_c0_g1_i3.p2 TRINITY_DN337_c0_g1~~TRINITY_DN337_c0_g1_i3.p2  ORF type:complete len:223 (-),score=107.90 TRINITY_DN337_c0_g1_i3:107-754(-)
MSAVTAAPRSSLSDRLFAAALFFGVVGAGLFVVDAVAPAASLDTYAAPGAGAVRPDMALGAAKKRMSIVLTRPTKGLGQKGDVVRVAPGYFRNFLEPTRTATVATEEILAEMRRKKLKEEAEALAKLEEAKKAALAFATIGKFTIKKQAGPDQKIFGSITEQDVADLIRNQMGRNIDKKDIILPEISALGTYPAEVVLHPEVRGRFNVIVVKTGK